MGFRSYPGQDLTLTTGLFMGFRFWGEDKYFVHRVLRRVIPTRGAGSVKKTEKCRYFAGIQPDTEKLFIFAQVMEGFQRAFNEDCI